MDTQRNNNQLVKDLATAHLVKYLLSIMEDLPSDQVLAIVDRGAHVLTDRDVFEGKVDPYEA